MRRAGAHNSLPDEDPIQTHEWELSVKEVVEQQGVQRAERLLHSAIAAGGEVGFFFYYTSLILISKCAIFTNLQLKLVNITNSVYDRYYMTHR